MMDTANTETARAIVAQNMFRYIVHLEKALERIATVYDWHGKIPDDSYVGESVALYDCIDIAKEALST